jgi:hypothetical protein
MEVAGRLFKRCILPWQALEGGAKDFTSGHRRGGARKAKGSRARRSEALPYSVWC